MSNVLLQNSRKADITDRLAIPDDPIARQLVLNTLDPGTAKTPDCRFVPPVIG